MRVRLMPEAQAICPDCGFKYRYVDEFDSHDGQLKITGADEHLRRYVQAIRKLRDAGYNRVIVLSDHGFFHWQPEDHEIVDDLPTGEVLWKHRRAMVGHDLSHNALNDRP